MHQFVDFIQAALIEPAADVRDIMQIVSAIKSDDQSAKMRPRSARLGIAANHNFGALNGLDLQPVASSFLNVWAGGALGEHAFQMKLLDLFEERFAIALDVLR